MSSGYSPWWKRKILYHIPRLFKKCPEGNYHWFWHRICFCVDHCDLLDMKTGGEYTLNRKGERWEPPVCYKDRESLLKAVERAGEGE